MTGSEKQSSGSAVRLDCFGASAPRNDGSNHRATNIAKPTRTCVAPNWIAIAKSALMPIDGSDARRLADVAYSRSVRLLERPSGSRKGTK
jgi:hypothetical protein